MSQQEPEATTPTPGSPAMPPLSDSDSRMWAMIAHLGAILAFFVSPLIVWLVFRERSKFVDDQAKEGLNFQLTLAVVYVGILTLSAVTE